MTRDGHDGIDQLQEPFLRQDLVEVLLVQCLGKPLGSLLTPADDLGDQIIVVSQQDACQHPGVRQRVQPGVDQIPVEQVGQILGQQVPGPLPLRGRLPVTQGVDDFLATQDANEHGGGAEVGIYLTVREMSPRPAVFRPEEVPRIACFCIPIPLEIVSDEMIDPLTNPMPDILPSQIQEQEKATESKE